MIRRIARPLLGAIFVSSGVDVLRNPGPRAQRAEPVTSQLAEVLPLPDDTEQLVRINAVAQLVAGTMLAAGKLPRLSAAVLAGSLVPTTVAGHRFWEEEDPRTRGQQRIHFLKNLALTGGWLYVFADSVGGREPASQQSVRSPLGRSVRS